MITTSRILKSSGFRPWSIAMNDNKFNPPSSVKQNYVNKFEYKDPSQYPIEDPSSVKHTLKSVHTPEELEPTGGNVHITRGFNLQGFYGHYVPFREPTFPKAPNVHGDGELTAGASFYRTDSWKSSTAQDPSILTVAKFAPDNIRPYGYYENAPTPTSTTPDGHMDHRHVRLSPGHADRKPFYYFINSVNAMIGASIIRQSVYKLLHGWWPAKDIQAAGVIEVDISKVRPGQNIVVKWRGKPVFIRHRTPDMIAAAQKDDALLGSLRDPQKDIERVQKEEWLVVVGICTHLGCVPFPDQGVFGGYFCPCHGSHYDHSGRVRLGPAPMNLEVPDYVFMDDTHIKLG